MSLLDYCNIELDKFMGDLHGEFNHEYPDELLELANTILRENPSALLDFI